MSIVETASGSIGIAGTGAVARALGRALVERGWNIAYVAGRDAERAQAAAAWIGPEIETVDIHRLAQVASHVLIAVADRAIPEVAGQLAESPGTLRVALHTCGSYGAEILAPLRARGIACGAIHPFQTFREPARGAADLSGSAFAVAGDPLAAEWAEAIAVALDGRVLRIREDARPLYHAAAVMASNYIAALLDSARHLLTSAGVRETDALPALAPIVRAAIENALELGPVEALTGPVARGDAATVQKHMAALADAAPAIRELYRAAGLRALDMAGRRGLDPGKAGSVHRALAG